MSQNEMHYIETRKMPRCGACPAAVLENRDSSNENLEGHVGGNREEKKDAGRFSAEHAVLYPVKVR